MEYDDELLALSALLAAVRIVLDIDDNPGQERK
jgi:hypothetical protein